MHFNVSHKQAPAAGDDHINLDVPLQKCTACPFRPILTLFACVICVFRKVIFEKQWFHLDSAVGHLYSSTFDIVSGALQLKKTTNSESPEGVCV